MSRCTGVLPEPFSGPKLRLLLFSQQFLEDRKHILLAIKKGSCLIIDILPASYDVAVDKDGQIQAEAFHQHPWRCIMHIWRDQNPANIILVSSNTCDEVG